MTTNLSPTLILFDIDGTLLLPRGCGRAAFVRTLAELYSVPPDMMQTMDFGGKTDWQLLLEVLVPVGYTPAEIQASIPAFVDMLARHLAAIIPDYEVQALPGALDLVESLRHDPRARLGLVTGNTGVTAPIKLRAAGFDPAAFPIGAFGHEAADRASLPPLAMQRARDYWGIAFPAGRVVIVGDTPADVHCARPIRARSVAVLTGFATREALVAAMPDVLLDDLSNRAAVEEALFGANEHG